MLSEFEKYDSIYKLIDWRQPAIVRYVGFSKGPTWNKRFRWHRDGRQTSNAGLVAWENSLVIERGVRSNLQMLDLEFILADRKIVLCGNEKCSAWEIAEMCWILQYQKSQDPMLPLLNIEEGGCLKKRSKEALTQMRRLAQDHMPELINQGIMCASCKAVGHASLGCKRERFVPG